MNQMNTHNSSSPPTPKGGARTPLRGAGGLLLCLFLACIPNTALAETAQQLANRLNTYGFSAAVRPAPNNNNVTVVNSPLGSTLTNNNQLVLNINAGVTIEWGANLTGTLVVVSGLGTIEIERGIIEQKGEGAAIDFNSATTGAIKITGGTVQNTGNGNVIINKSTGSINVLSGKVAANPGTIMSRIDCFSLKNCIFAP